MRHPGSLFPGWPRQIKTVGAQLGEKNMDTEPTCIVGRANKFAVKRFRLLVVFQIVAFTLFVASVAMAKNR